MNTLTIIALSFNVYAILVHLFGSAPWRGLIAVTAFSWAVLFWVAGLSQLLLRALL